MKRKLALLMAFMMAATLLPAQPSFAATKNQVSRIISLGNDSETTTDGTLSTNLYLKGEDSTPEIKGEFELHLDEGAEWKYTNQTINGITAGTSAQVRKVTDRILLVTPNAGLKDINIPVYVKLDGAPEGQQKVKVVPNNSTVTAGEYVYATVGAGSIRASVDKKVKIARTGEETVTLIFKENTPTSFDGKQITLRLPKDFSWGSIDTAKSSGASFMAPDGRELKFTPNVDNGKQDTVYLTVPVKASRNAAYGDVDVTINGAEVSPSSLIVAEYVRYGVDVKVEKVLSVLAGKDVEGLYKSKITLEEPVVSSLSGSRYIEFKFVDENGKDVNASLQHGQTLRLTNKSGDATLEIDPESIKFEGTNSTSKTAYVASTVSGTRTVKANQFDIFVKKQSNNRAAKYELEVPFVVASNFTGKLYLQVKGAGVEEQKVQIADVKAPVTFEVKKPLPLVKIGLQKQMASDIKIVETEAGALQDYMLAGKASSSNTATYTIVPEEKFAMTFKSVKFEKEGDISIDKVDTQDSDKELYVRIDRKSTKASTITLKDITVTLDRTVPYGAIRLKGQFGVVGNRHDLTNNVQTFDYITTVTPVSDDRRVTTVFTIGEKAFTQVIGGVKEEMTAEVAPFIQDNRTMLPVRYIANAVGAEVNYDPMTRVATFTKNQVVVSINIDKDVMYVNGSPVKLASKPTNVEGRIFLPLVNIAQAFGLKQGETLIWNAEKKTVTILPQDATAEEIAAAK